MKRPFSLSLTILLSATVLTLSACPAPNSGPTIPSPDASTTPSAPNAEATPEPQSSVEPTPEPTPEATPEPMPSVEPTAEPTPEATPTPPPLAQQTPTPSPSLLPSPTPTPVAGQIQVFVYDETDRVVSSTKVTLRSTSLDTPFEVTETFNGGSFTFKDIPQNAIFEVIATAPGYNTQTQSALTSPTVTPVVRFEDKSAISTKPEVIRVEPNFPALVEPFEPITLYFSENIDKQSLEASVALQLEATNATTFDVGTPIPAPISVQARNNDSIYNSSHFTFEWDTERKVTIKPLYGWPIANAKTFRLSLNYLDGGTNTGGIQDNNGTKARFPLQGTGNESTPVGDDDSQAGSIEDGPFRLGNTYKPFLPITITSSSGLPKTRSTGVQIENNSEIGGNDAIVVNFNRILRFSLTTGATVAGGANDAAGNAPAGGVASVTAQQAAANYFLRCNDAPVAFPANTAASYIDSDSVRIVAPSGMNLFSSNDRCDITYAAFLDIFGKAMDPDTESFIVN